MAILSLEELHQTPTRIFVPFQLTSRATSGFGIVPVIEKHDLSNDLTALRKAIRGRLSDMKPEDHILLGNMSEYIIAESIATALHSMSTVQCLCHRFPEQYEEIKIGEASW